MTECDVVIIGAGAAGLMCAIEAGKRGRRVLVLDLLISQVKKSSCLAVGAVYRSGAEA